MNRRGFVGRIFGVLGIAAAPAVLAEPEARIGSFSDIKPVVEPKEQDIWEVYEDKYWDAQRHINALEDERRPPMYRDLFTGADV